MSQPCAARPGRCATARPDHGSATVWVLVACLMIWVVTLAALGVGSAVVCRHRAAAAADLAALAAARRLVEGQPQPCAAAHLVAAAQGARLTGCAVRDGTVLVVVEVAVDALNLLLPPARARARAGGSGEGLPRGQMGSRWRVSESVP